MSLRSELATQFAARVAVVNVVSYEEARVLRELTEWTRGAGCPAEHGLYTWDIGDQFRCLKPAAVAFDVEQETTTDKVLRKLDTYEGSATFVLKDLHMSWEVPADTGRRPLIRTLRNLAQRWPATAKNLVLLTPEPVLPLELKRDVVTIEVSRPSADEMEELLTRVFQGTNALREVTGGLRAKIIEAALGLSSQQAERALRVALVKSRDGKLDHRCIDGIVEAKKAMIRESGALEYYPVSETEDAVGGLAELKRWLRQRGQAFGDEAREYGIGLPKGLALIGIPGTGKSLCAKVTAGSWKLPLLRLDMGAVFGSLLGASERNIREAMQIAEIIAPCVLWVDEIEKAFAGSTGDGGTAARVLGTFLTWMQEKTTPVFVLATANNVAHLPPEFLRKGRFDEVFFLDLPTDEEREAILEVHLRRRKYSLVRQRFDLPEVAAATVGFVGAELEAVVEAALFPAFMDSRRDLQTDDLLRAAGDMVPLAQSHATHIEELRRLVTSGQARNASRATTTQAVPLSGIRGERTHFMDV